MTRNVAKLVEPPRVVRRPVTPLSPDQARTFLEAIRGDRLEVLYLIALGVGLRHGEILGLSRSDVDLEVGTLAVRQALQRINGRLVLVEPKSATSHRVVALPTLVLDALRGIVPVSSESGCSPTRAGMRIRATLSLPARSRRRSTASRLRDDSRRT